MAFRVLSGIVGASLLIVAAYQLITGSVAIRWAKTRQPRVPIDPLATRLFALGLVCMGVLLAILAWQPTGVSTSVRLILGVGLLGLAYVFWWSAIRTWKRNRELR